MLSKKYRKIIISKKLLPELRENNKFSLALFLGYLIYFSILLNFCFTHIYQIKLIIHLITGINIFIASVFSFFIIIFLLKQVSSKYQINKIVFFEMNPILFFAVKKCWMEISTALIIISSFWFLHGILFSLFATVIK